jgi:hypothetical protein
MGFVEKLSLLKDNSFLAPLKMVWIKMVRILNGRIYYVSATCIYIICSQFILSGRVTLGLFTAAQYAFLRHSEDLWTFFGVTTCEGLTR